MTWKDKFVWRKLSFEEVREGMEAKLVISKPWSDDAWVVGRLNQIFKVVELTDGHENAIGVYVPDFVNDAEMSEDENPYHCFEKVDRFLFRG